MLGDNAGYPPLAGTPLVIMKPYRNFSDSLSLAEGMKINSKSLFGITTVSHPMPPSFRSKSHPACSKGV